MRQSAPLTAHCLTVVPSRTPKQLAAARGVNEPALHPRLYPKENNKDIKQSHKQNFPSSRILACTILVGIGLCVSNGQSQQVEYKEEGFHRAASHAGVC